MKHTWRYAETDPHELYGYQPCRRCGQSHAAMRPTLRCVCWKMRLPKRKEK